MKLSSTQLDVLHGAIILMVGVMIGIAVGKPANAAVITPLATPQPFITVTLRIPETGDTTVLLCNMNPYNDPSIKNHNNFKVR